VGGPLTILAVIMVINAAIAAFYYLRVVVYMYMREPRTEAEPLRHGRLLWSGLAVTTVLVIVLGLFPTTVFDAVSQAAQALPPIEVTQASN
jgi:NADH-quinone oxidoreductase subunit N